jgi:hypothetical protein
VLGSSVLYIVPIWMTDASSGVGEVSLEGESASGTRIVCCGRCGSVEDRLNISRGTEREDSPVD